MIQFEQGCTYDVAHLKPFDMALALAGHPLASSQGHQARNFRMLSDDLYALDWWVAGHWHMSSCYVHQLQDTFMLAPLAVKDGKPLHVGDEMEIYREFADDDASWVLCKVHSHEMGLALDLRPAFWRWPKE
jgi:hypothetical protein